MNIEEAKKWLASIEVHSEAEASYKELILSTLETVLKELEESKAEAERYFETTIKQAYKFGAEVKKKDKIIDLMAGAIDSLDSQLVICKYKDKEDVKKKFEEYFEEKIENEIQEEN